MQITLYHSHMRGQERNTVYPIRANVTNVEEMRQVAGYDHVCATYQENRRTKENFICADCIPMDCDNDHSDDPHEWKNALDVKAAFPDVAFFVISSRNHLKEKHGRTARPRFHVYFPCSNITDADTYELLKKQIQAKFPCFDPNGLGAARFLFGVENPEVVSLVDGTKKIDECVWGGNLPLTSATITPPAAKKKEYKGRFQVPDMIKKDERNATITRLVGALQHTGITDESIEFAAIKTAREHCEKYGVDDFKDKEVRGIVKSILKKDKGKLRIVKDGDEEIVGGFNMTQACQSLNYLDPDSAQFEVEMEQYSAKARSVGIKNFRKIYKAFVRKQIKLARSEELEQNEAPPSKQTMFTGQWSSLYCGIWEASDTKIARVSTIHDKTQSDGEVVACYHPIMPLERIVDHESGEEKITLTYAHGKEWKKLTVPKKRISTRNEIIELANNGVNVTDLNARALIEYLADIERMNYDTIPTVKGTSHLGWIKGLGFAPYTNSVQVFPPGKTEKAVLDSLQNTGSFSAWLDNAKAARKRSPVNKLLLAASFASVLLEPLSVPSFFVHVYGSTGTGKSVGQMLAASVWGRPIKGDLFQTLNSTVVGIELFSSFLRNLPVILDEAQTERNAQVGRALVQIYKIVAEAGRLRGTQAVTLSDKHEWHNLFITSGEHPMLSDTDGGGAYNRAIEIQLNGQNINGRDCALCVSNNYGNAGRQFIQKFDLEKARTLYTETLKSLPANINGKQGSCVAILLTADQLACEYVYDTEDALTLSDILSLDAVKDEATTISTEARIIDFIDEWVASNSLKFLKGDGDYTLPTEMPRGRIYGKIKNGYVYIVPSILRKAVADAGYPDLTTTLKKLADEGRLSKQNGINTRITRLLGRLTRCYCIAEKPDSGKDFDSVEPPVDPEELVHQAMAEMKSGLLSTSKKEQSPPVDDDESEERLSICEFGGG